MMLLLLLLIVCSACQTVLYVPEQAPLECQRDPASAGVMACSQELHKGDLVAVSVAMEAPGAAGYITRGSIVPTDQPATPSLYIGVAL